MKLLLDMNLSPRWQDYLRRHAFVGEHWSNMGAQSAEDATIMAHARFAQGKPLKCLWRRTERVARRLG